MATVPLATFFFWQAPMVAYGAFTVTAATAWLFFGRDRHKTQPSGTPSASQLPENGNGVTVMQALTQRSTLLLSLAVMGAWSLGNAIGSWLPSYYNEVFNMPLEKASSITALITTFGTAACILGGIIPMRIGRRKPFLIIPGIFMGLSAICAVLFNNPAIIFISVACFGIFSNLQTPTLFTIPMELPNVSPRMGVLVISAMQSGGNIGNVIGPLVVGYLADTTGSYLPGFIICAAFSLGLLAAGLLLPETGYKARRDKITSN